MAFFLSVLPLALTRSAALLPHPPLLLSRPAISRVPAVLLLEEEGCIDEICEVDDLPLEDQADARWQQGTAYAEESRKYRRTVYMHDEWTKHRSSDRFQNNMKTIFQSGVSQSLSTELTFITSIAAFVVVAKWRHGSLTPPPLPRRDAFVPRSHETPSPLCHAAMHPPRLPLTVTLCGHDSRHHSCLVGTYQDLGGVTHPGPLHFLAGVAGQVSLPSMPFTVAMPALSLMLVFRTNTAYARWNEARTLWGGVINNCRNVARQANLFYPETAAGMEARDQLVGGSAAFSKCLRNFLRGPTDDFKLSGELNELVEAGLLSASQAESCMAAKNRPFYCLSMMSTNVRRADLEPMDRARLDTTFSVLGDLTGKC